MKQSADFHNSGIGEHHAKQKQFFIPLSLEKNEHPINPAKLESLS